MSAEYPVCAPHTWEVSSVVATLPPGERVAALDRAHCWAFTARCAAARCSPHWTWVERTWHAMSWYILGLRAGLVLAADHEEAPW